MFHKPGQSLYHKRGHCEFYHISQVLTFNKSDIDDRKHMQILCYQITVMCHSISDLSLLCVEILNRSLGCKFWLNNTTQLRFILE